ncbi:YeeE/YedE family protein [Alisedimentitalea sp. MJ-SS2]|uniref:YeeE/YedE family protein n=1 Tax=Aliisedimentitalea sp. MJ-SS2 TaxID=3049795 RepID=UPI002909B2B0|nr:YeeE/YedE family protein [Alisedimentitalea sp. MJ-SS2]MDU8926209.1 YeeE/YedE family protein [Alisedimentitalea sp. MJ-SS2]
MIDAWKEVAVENAAMYIGVGGLLIGLVFGAILVRTNFCTMGSLSDIANFGDWRRFRSWLTAIAVAMIGVFWIERTGFADMTASLYLSPRLMWGGHIAGGLVFGIGMVLAGGCVSKNLARAGGGDIRSLIVLWLIGGTAYMTIGGLFAESRVAFIDATSTDLSALGAQDQALDTILASATGLSASMAQLITVVVLAGGMLVYAFSDKGFRSSPTHVIAGIGIGLLVVAGWVLTAFTFDEFADNPTLASLSYVRPAGDSIDYFMRYTADKIPGFAVTTTVGALFGAFFMSLALGKFHLATFSNPQDTILNLVGAGMMGVGGVTALGCTVGQAVTGFSTLALGSLITFLAIIVGGLIGLKAMERFI